MIKPGYDQAAILETFRGMYRGARYPHVTVPSLLADGEGARLRERVSADGLASFWVADRGRYQANDRVVEEPLFAALRGFAERILDARLDAPVSRWLRFVHGDYQTIRGDSVERARPGRHLELTLDFSDWETDQAEMVYSDGTENFVVPQWPGSVTLVERVDSLYRYERYLNHLVGEAEVWRLRLSFAFAT